LIEVAMRGVLVVIPLPQQFRQPRDVDGHSPSLVFRQRLGPQRFSFTWPCADPVRAARRSDTPARLSRTLQNCGALTIRKVFGRFALSEQSLNIRR
jgi:hypothetical protein